MALIDLMRANIGTILLLLASEGAAQTHSNLTAVLIQTEGQATLSSQGERGFPSVRLAVQRLVIRRGEVVHLPAGAHVTLLCSTEMLVSLPGPQDWVLDEMACRPGVRVPEGSYGNLVAFAGRILPRHGTLLLENETRYVNPLLGPFLLSPLDTRVIDIHPRLVWTHVPGAIEYEIVIRGPVATSIRLAADELHCGPGSGPWHDLDVCSWAPSGKWPALDPERSVFLKFGSRRAVTAPFHQAQEVYQIHLLPANEQRSLQEGLRQITALSLDKASRLLLTAGAYAQGGLYVDAIATYDEALQAQEIPEARVTLGDLYLTLGLMVPADREYRQVVAGFPNSAAQAAAELGLGQVAYSRKLFGDARAHFERARELYTTLGLAAEAEDARAAATRFQAHSGNDSPDRQHW